MLLLLLRYAHGHRGNGHRNGQTFVVYALVMILLMMMPVSIVYGTQDTAASTNAATGDAASTSTTAIETAASAATVMAMMIVDEHATAHGN